MHDTYTCDYLLTGGILYDGFGGTPFVGDVAIRDDQIVGLGPNLAAQYTAASTIPVNGLAVSPGFIDIHTHSDFTILINSGMDSSVFQGVTTELFGNCGMAIGLIGSGPDFDFERRWSKRGGISMDWSRMSGFFNRIEEVGTAINVGSLAGHGTIRKSIMGFDQRPPTADELAGMGSRVTEAMSDGAYGLSSGLEYIPGSYADLDELCAMAEFARVAGGFYASHLRSEGDDLVPAVREALAVGERTGIAVQMSHHKVEGAKNWGRIHETLRMMDDARASGLDVLADQYPYTAFMTGLSVILLPAWVQGGGPTDVTARLTDPETRAKIVDEIKLNPPIWNLVQVGIARKRRDTQGLTLQALAERENKDPVDAAIDLLIDEEGAVAAAYFAISEDDVMTVMRDPHTMIGSDAVASSPIGFLSEDKTHPRSYGAFSRVLAEYVRNKSVLTLAEAIRRMTSLPAQRLKIKDRGRLVMGAKADLVVFNPDTVQDRATFEDPHLFPAGVEHVMVNGRFAIKSGVQTEARAGRVLRHHAG